MKVYGQLEKAQLENTTSDTASHPKGMATYRTDLNIAKVSNGTAYKALIDEDSTQNVSNKTLLTSSSIGLSAGSTSVTDYVQFDEVAAPATPAANKNRMYFKSDGLAYYKNDAGTEFQFSVGATSLSVTTKTANYTVTTSDYVILCNAASGGFTITLPAATSLKEFVIIKTDSSANLVTIVPTGGDTLLGETSQKLASQYDAITFLAAGGTIYYAY